ncbi:MAG TPA: hypothetical protein VGJ95_00440 [Pseudonocardiaceae bacterium]|jgi:hypothetical protein
MISAIVPNERVTSLACPPLGGDLMIHEFDLWTDQTDTVSLFSGVCWLPDAVLEWAE